MKNDILLKAKFISEHRELKNTRAFYIESLSILDKKNINERLKPALRKGQIRSAERPNANTDKQRVRIESVEVGLKKILFKTNSNFHTSTEPVESYDMNYKNIETIKIIADYFKDTVIKGENSYITMTDNPKQSNQYQQKRKILSYYRGFDTEYVDLQGIDEGYFKELDDTRAKELFEDNERQDLVSMQSSLMIDNGVFINTFIFFPESYSQRFTYKFLINTLEREFLSYFGNTKNFEYNVTYMAHKNIVDLTKMDNLLSSGTKKFLTSIHNCIETVKGLPIKVYDKKNRNYKSLGTVQFRDSLCLYPPTSLAKLGENLGLPKLDIGDNISRMREYFEEDCKGFYEYAIRDAQISVKFAYAYFPDVAKGIPLTIASMAATAQIEALTSYFNWTGEEYDVIWRGIDPITLEKKKGEKLKPERYKVSRQQVNICADHYYGGRNETFTHGYYEGFFQDIDMSGFYPTLGSMIPFLDYSQVPYNVQQGRMDDRTFDMNKIEVGMCQVNFYNNTGVIPVITQKTPANGLIFCKYGQGVWVDNQTLKSAYAQGVEIEILTGFIFKTRDDLENPLKVYFDKEKLQRKEAKEKYGKKSPEQEICKLRANSVTGKMGQGITKKKSFDIKIGLTVETSISKIENPPYIMTITAMGRAAITETMILFQNYFKTQIHNVVTDGFMFEVPYFLTDEEINKILFSECEKNRKKYPNLALILDYHKNNGNNIILEVKHQGQELLTIKTRMCILLGETEDLTQISLTGYKKTALEREMSDIEFGRYMIDKFANRNGRIKTITTNLLNTRRYFNRGNENSVVSVKRLNMNYDYKRKPILSSLNTDNHYGILSFITEPYEDLEEFYSVKEKMENQKDIQIKQISDLQKIDILEKMRTTCFNFPKKYTSIEIAEKTISALSKLGILWYKNKKIEDYKTLKNLVSELDVDFQKLKKDSAYYRMQKLSENQREQSLTKDKQIFLDFLQEFFKTDCFEIRE